MMFLLLATLAPALAQCAYEWEYDRDTCECLCESTVYVWPPSGSVVPTNAFFNLDRVLGIIYVLRNGEDVEYERLDDGDDRGIKLRPIEEPEPGDIIEVWIPQSTDPAMAGTWTVGDGPDHDPPQWDGKYAVDTIVNREDDCGFAEHSHYITFRDVSDDLGLDLVRSEVRGIGEFIRDDYDGKGTGFDVRWDACGYDDLSLYDEFHRAYEVTLEDAAGNTTGPFVVRTGRNPLGCGGCGGPSDEEYDRVIARLGPTDVVGSQGCSTTPRSLPLLFPLTLAFLRRRRRH
jgi:hypothetical protein